MKQSIRITALSMACFLCISNASLAQDLAVNAPVQGEKIISNGTLPMEFSATPVLSANTLAESNPKLIRNFSQMFPSSDKVTWSKMENGYYVSFEKEGQRSSAVFTNNGMLNYTIAACSLQQLPVSLQQTINKKYDGYRLFNASKVQSNGNEAYNVVLENAEGFITLLHTEDGTEETKKVNKLAVN